MKYLIAITMFMISCVASASEDHLVFVPTLFQAPTDDNKIYILKTPLISGYGADFESYIGRIAAPYMTPYLTSATPMDRVEDFNPASLAGISLSAVWTNDLIYDVTVDYSNVKGKWSNDIRLLRSVIQCIYIFGDELYHSHLKARLMIKGLKADSILHSEFSKIIEKRTMLVKKESN